MVIERESGCVDAVGTLDVQLFIATCGRALA